MMDDLFSKAFDHRVEGTLSKMPARLDEQSVPQYSLSISDKVIPLNPLIGQEVELNFSGKIFCQHCGKPTNKSYGQGYCWDHFQSLAQNDSCMMSPEKCHFDAGTCREPEWAEKTCFQGHYVYLANASGIKVGITRGNQLPTRWIDQGAVQGLPIARVSERKLSGALEVLFKQHVDDKTNWRKMLAGPADNVDLAKVRDQLFAKCSEGLADLQSQYGISAIQMLDHADEWNIKFPVQRYLTKITSINPEKQNLVQGILMGVKGQYLIFDSGVINIRRYGGYEVSFSY